jgi:hypothetical protein
MKGVERECGELESYAVGFRNRMLWGSVDDTETLM